MGFWDWVDTAIDLITPPTPMNVAVRLLQKPMRNMAESVVDNVIRDRVDLPVVGSVVYCELAVGMAEHSGIFIGSEQIVHLNGDGLIESVPPAVFLDRLGGYNTAISIYVSCWNGSPVGSREAAMRAKALIGRRRSYNVLLDNCHQFTAGCLTGNFENSANAFWMLKDEAAAYLNANEWRVWNR